MRCAFRDSARQVDQKASIHTKTQPVYLIPFPPLHSSVQGATGVAANLREGPHRRNRLDTLESLDGYDHGEGRGHRRGRSGLKTYEQLRTLHPEEEYEFSLEQ